MSYLDRDTLGMYKSQDEKGPGPSCHSVKPLDARNWGGLNASGGRLLLRNESHHSQEVSPDEG